MVVPYNPCGAIVEYGRERYTTKCRFFHDSDVEAEITWYPAHPNARPLPYDSAISQLVWDRELVGMDPLHFGVGEVSGAKHTISHMKPVPGAFGQHQCGTREDFEAGAHFDPLRPPIPYRPDGLPTCCPGGIGGLFWGGRGVVPPPAKGGVKWRGHGVEGWDGEYFATGAAPFALELFGFIFPNQIWSSAGAGVAMYSPIVTGVPGLWRLESDGSFGPFPAGTWEATGWNGWGTGFFNLVVGVGPPATYTVVRGDTL